MLELNRLPSIEAQLAEWIDLMVARDTLKNLKILPSATLRWKCFEVHCRWTNWRKVTSQEVHALEVARIHIPEGLRERGWFRTFVALLKRMSPTDGIIVEEASQARNPWMRGALCSWGFCELSEGTDWLDLRLLLCRCAQQTAKPGD
jgi:hypothetical protein